MVAPRPVARRWPARLVGRGGRQAVRWWQPRGRFPAGRLPPGCGGAARAGSVEDPAVSTRAGSRLPQAASVHARMSSNSALQSVRSAIQPCTVRAAVVCPSSRAARNSSTAAERPARTDGGARRSGARLLQLGQPACPVTAVERGGACTMCRANRSGGYTPDRARGPRAEVLGLTGLAAQERGVGEHRGCARPAASPSSGGGIPSQWPRCSAHACCASHPKCPR